LPLRSRQARSALTAWLEDYNTVRPHSAIGNKVSAILYLMTGNPDKPVVSEAEFSSQARFKVGGKRNDERTLLQTG